MGLGNDCVSLVCLLVYCVLGVGCELLRYVTIYFLLVVGLVCLCICFVYDCLRLVCLNGFVLDNSVVCACFGLICFGFKFACVWLVFAFF